MWGSVLGLAFLGALNPVRLGITLLVMSRPQPVQNLFAYWIGTTLAGLPYILVPLMILHFTPIAHDLSAPATVAGSTMRHIQIGMGVLALSIAALMSIRFLARQRAHQPTPGVSTSTPTLDSETSTLISRLLGSAQAAPSAGGSAVRRLADRARDAWENGSLWVSVVIGAGCMPSVDGVLSIVAIIVASGATVGTQVSAAIAFIVGLLAVVEIILLGSVVTPVKTEAVLRLLHDWSRANRRKILIANFAVVGVLLVGTGLGSI